MIVEWILKFSCIVAAYIMSPFFKSAFMTMINRRRILRRGNAWRLKTYEEITREIERNAKSSLMYFGQGDLENAKRQATDAATYSVFLLKKIEEVHK